MPEAVEHSEELARALRGLVATRRDDLVTGAADVNALLDDAGVSHPDLHHRHFEPGIAQPEYIPCDPPSHPVVTTWTDSHGHTHQFWSCS